MMHVAVIGAGISGLATAQHLRELNIAATLFEHSSRVGGLISCTMESGSLFHRVGGHVFNTRNPVVRDWFWSRFDQGREFVAAQRKAAILLDGAIIPYPLELNIGHLPVDVASAAVSELVGLAAQPASTLGLEAVNFEAFLLANFGPTLCAQYFVPYNAKIWRRDLASIPMDWLAGKLPMISPQDILVKNIVGLSDDMVHSCFYYPVRGGSQFIADRLSEGLEIRRASVGSLRRTSGGWLLDCDPRRFDAVVYTGDCRRLASMLEVPEMDPECRALLDWIDELQANGTTTLLCECDANDLSWLYLPSPLMGPHRMIMTGNLSALNNSSDLPAGRSTCTVEYSGYLSESDFIAELSGLPFAPTPVAYNYCPASYVVHAQGASERLGRLASILNRADLYLCGRFAEWKYHNMDVAIASALRTAEAIHAAVG